MTQDIRPKTKDWPYEPGNVTVRRIRGDGNSQKIQIRLDLGLLQLEPTGRPDGKRPFSFESLLHYHRHELEQYRQEHGTDLGFELDSEECRELRQEALMYYHRYLACFILEDFESVVHDTERNLQVFDLCRRYAANKSDRMALEQYRPYVIMMNTRSKAHMALHRREYKPALHHVRTGMKIIRRYFEDADQLEEYEDCSEAAMLRQLARAIRRKMPQDPIRRLKRRLRKALAEQRFEDAHASERRIDDLKSRRKSKRDNKEDRQ